MSQQDIPTGRDLEMQVFDAEAAAKALLETPKLQPASISRLITLDEAITARLSALENSGEGGGEEAAKMRELHERMLGTLRAISTDPLEAQNVSADQ